MHCADDVALPAMSALSDFQSSLQPLKPLITHSLDLLTKTPSTTSNASATTTNPPPIVIPTRLAYPDLASLSKLCSAHITGLSLALRPKVDYKTAAGLAEKWLKELEKLDTLVSVWMASIQGHSNVWDKEVRWAGLALLEAFQGLYAICERYNADKDRQALLQATGQVWAAVESLSGKTSPSLAVALSKALKSTQEAISDAHAELRDLLEEGDSSDPEEGEGEGEPMSELDAFLNGLQATGPLADVEAERIKGLSMLIRLCKLLFKRTADWTLAALPSEEQERTLQELHRIGDDLSAQVDDLVMAAQPTQDLDELQSLLDDVHQTCGSIGQLPVLSKPPPTEIEAKVQQLSVDDNKTAEPTTTTVEAEAEERKWRDMAVSQIKKASDKITSL